MAPEMAFAYREATHDRGEGSVSLLRLRGSPIALSITLWRVKGDKVSEAVKLIVDGFVNLKDRMALEEMRAHRQRLRGELQQKAGELDIVGYSLNIIEADLQEIEDGFVRLQS